MSKGQLLLLDINLLFPGGISPLLEKIAEESDLSQFDKEEELLSGLLTEDDFWQIIKDESGADDYTIESWRDWWRQELKPEGVVKHLEGWRKQVNLGVSGNAFAPWVRRSLKDDDVLRHLRYIWLSSETKQLLPSPDAFSAPFALGLDTLYLDSDLERLGIAELYGFSGQVAGDKWIEAVNLWID